MLVTKFPKLELNKIKDFFGNTLLLISVQFCQFDIVEYLIHKSPELIDLPNKVS